VTGGTVMLDGEDYLALKTSERALRGLFLAFQYPVEIAGVTVGKFLKRVIELRQDGGKGTSSSGDKSAPGGKSAGGGMNVTAYIKQLREAMDYMEMDQGFINRSLNQGFSGGEKKRMEVLQMLMLKPSLAILDETDSGLDIDALKVVANGVNSLRGNGRSFLLVTHYQRLLDHIRPDFVHVLAGGRIIRTGDRTLALELEAQGYDGVIARAAV